MVVLREHFLGSLLGLAVGDAVAAPYEGLDAPLIIAKFGQPRNVVDRPPVETIDYTDDTQMMIGLAESLIEHGEVNQDALAARFVKNYDPWRGYGQGTRKLIDGLGDGGNWRQLSFEGFQSGSHGNVEAMPSEVIGPSFR